MGKIFAGEIYQILPPPKISLIGVPHWELKIRLGASPDHIFRPADA